MPPRMNFSRMKNCELLTVTVERPDDDPAGWPEQPFGGAGRLGRGRVRCRCPARSHARIARLYYGAADPKGGAIEQGPRLFAQPQCLHRPEVYGGLAEAEASAKGELFSELGSVHAAGAAAHRP